MRGFEAADVTRLICAFSREPGKPKTYVQQAIADHGEEVWPLLQQEAIVFVCGEASRMAPEVRQAFIDLFVARTGAAVPDGKAWLAGLAANQRYLSRTSGRPPRRSHLRRAQCDGKRHGSGQNGQERPESTDTHARAIA